MRNQEKQKAVLERLKIIKERGDSMDPNTLKIVDTGELKTSKGDQELT